MSRLIDLTGQRFGALTVLSRSDVPKYGRVAWLCRCDCGKEIVADSGNLRAGHITSCGCGMARFEAHRKPCEKLRHDLTGRTFGELTAVRFVSRDRWLWRCSCGKECVIRASNVLRGKTVSCGHVLADTAREKVAANIFQHHDGTSLTAIRPILQGKLRSTNTTGVTGVTVRRYKARIAYCARIVVRGKEIRLGEFPTLEAAAAARKRAEETYFAPILERYDKPDS